ncbi:hypothetical protein C3433_23270 [Citrobacter freundii]|nr:hypothetical protein [Salmonella enterica]EGS4300351.1 hypothetical protein [Salmonella enterica]EIP9141947.1 hypothetical protein [Salmonella enterica]EIT1624848.1 hypothetical protein [Salmonella enterica]POT24389.1 hypothetical protein C3433_23270 [Citrobacter freundii]
MYKATSLYSLFLMSFNLPAACLLYPIPSSESYEWQMHSPPDSLPFYTGAQSESLELTTTLVHTNYSLDEMNPRFGVGDLGGVRDLIGAMHIPDGGGHTSVIYTPQSNHRYGNPFLAAYTNPASAGTPITYLYGTSGSSRKKTFLHPTELTVNADGCRDLNVSEFVGMERHDVTVEYENNFTLTGAVTTTRRYEVRHILTMTINTPALHFGSIPWGGAGSTASQNLNITLAAGAGTRVNVTYAYTSETGDNHNVLVENKVLPSTEQIVIPNNDSQVDIISPVTVVAKEVGDVRGRLQVTAQIP